uniref:ShKT domain-containing protein n=1 Tax=Romanomermis culicivorax TaxID=13658 RepID=A0A915HWZ4_ROMCU
MSVCRIFYFILFLHDSGIRAEISTGDLTATSQNCFDSDPFNCPRWALTSGEKCREAKWVEENCKLSCGLCPKREEIGQNSNFAQGSKHAAAVLNSASEAVKSPTATPDCADVSPQCPQWAAGGQCTENSFVIQNCKISCRRCGAANLPKQYDAARLPLDLQPIGFLVGKWRSEFDGKIRFPTIPVFTYGEQLDITISETPLFGPPSLNYSAFAWGIGGRESLHGECGFLIVKNRTNQVALSTAMSNGFTTIEEGEVNGNRIILKLVNIGRISWGRDQPVLDLRREFELFDNGQILEQRTKITISWNHFPGIFGEKIDFYFFKIPLKSWQAAGDLSFKYNS